MSKEEHITRLKISKVIENDDGTSTLHFDLEEDFIEWFKEKEGLERFSHKRFAKFVNESLTNNNFSGEKDFSGVIGRVVSEEKP